MIVPLCRLVMWSAASRPFKNPAKQAISQILKNFRLSVSKIPIGILAPMLNTTTSISPISFSIFANNSFVDSSLRASQAKAWAFRPVALISLIKGVSLSPFRRVAQTVSPRSENLRTIALPIASPAPIINATLFVIGFTPALQIHAYTLSRHVYITPSMDDVVFFENDGS